MDNIYESGNLIYIIPRLNGETDNYYYEKCRYIGERRPKTGEEFKKLLVEALIYCNTKLLGCVY